MTQTLIIKLGGELFESDSLHATLRGIAALTVGDAPARVVLVHGGGPQATALQRRLGQEVKVVGGRRITDEAALEVMKMSLSALNADLCGGLIAAGARPVGLNGTSSRVIAGVKRPPRVISGCGPDPVDFGQVGDVVGVNVALLRLLLDAGYTPALACLAADERGAALNINGDVVANHVAEALEADHLILLTGIGGGLAAPPDPASRIPRLRADEAAQLIREGVIAGGMIPKIEASIEVLRRGRVGAIHILGPLRDDALPALLSGALDQGTTLTP